jgi:hypothetical protein
VTRKRTHTESEESLLSQHDPSEQVRHLRRQVVDLERELEEARVATGEAMEVVAAIQSAVAAAKPVKISYVPQHKSKTPCTHVLHITDLHYGAVVDANEVDGFGEFSPAIAEQRVGRLAQAIIEKTAAQRSGYNVPWLHVIGTADYISGDIHPELQVTNAFPAPVQAVRCGYLIGGMLMAFAPHFERVTFDALTLDNHGRLTKKPQATQGGMNNWSYVVAEIARRHVCEQKTSSSTFMPSPRR